MCEILSTEACKLDRYHHYFLNLYVRRPITQLYTKNMFYILNNVLSLNCWIKIGDEALNELQCWNDLLKTKG